MFSHSFCHRVPSFTGHIRISFVLYNNRTDISTRKLYLYVLVYMFVCRILNFLIVFGNNAAYLSHSFSIYLMFHSVTGIPFPFYYCREIDLMMFLSKRFRPSFFWALFIYKSKSFGCVVILYLEWKIHKNTIRYTENSNIPFCCGKFLISRYSLKRMTCSYSPLKNPKITHNFRCIAIQNVNCVGILYSFVNIYVKTLVEIKRLIFRCDAHRERERTAAQVQITLPAR